MMTKASAVERYVRHAERFGVELVFETAAGLGEREPDLTAIELVTLARRLKAIYPNFDPAKPDAFVETTGAGDVRLPDDFASADADKRDAYRREQAKRRYLDRIAPVLDALGAPAPTSARRVCEWCGKAIAGRVDRRTCSPAHRKALDRAGGVGPFSRLDVTPTSEVDQSPGPARFVTPTARKQGRFEAENRGEAESREVPEIPGQLDLLTETPST